jgi:complement component 1 Q subcomponent-binding protein, mitochondrial
LIVNATATESIFVIDNVGYDPKSLPSPETAQTEYEARERYNGPPWQQLDEDLQVLVERYLEERGINSALAIFIPDYAELKEQKEYVTWLKNFKAFIDQ